MISGQITTYITLYLMPLLSSKCVSKSLVIDNARNVYAMFKIDYQSTESFGATDRKYADVCWYAFNIHMGILDAVRKFGRVLFKTRP